MPAKTTDIKSLHIDTYGEVFSFQQNENTDVMYAEEVAEMFAAALRHFKFSGRCEYLSGAAIPFLDILAVGILLRNTKNKTPKYDFWKEVEAFVQASMIGKSFEYLGMEYASRRALVGEIILHGTFLLEDGRIKSAVPSGLISDITESPFYNALVEQVDA